MDLQDEIFKSIIFVYDQTGKLIYQSSENSNSFNINLTNQSKGVYFLKIKVGESIREWKVIKL